MYRREPAQVADYPPTPDAVVRHMSFDERTGGFWFGTDFNTIGHAVVR